MLCRVPLTRAEDSTVAGTFLIQRIADPSSKTTSILLFVMEKRGRPLSQKAFHAYTAARGKGGQ